MTAFSICRFYECKKSLATISKSCVARKLGTLPSAELVRVKETLAAVFKQILK